MKNWNYTIKEGEHAGVTLWSGRYCAVAAFIFCNIPDTGWCVLANKRGKGTDKYQGYWNVPGGYLEASETAPECCSRETYEETGVKIEPEEFTLWDAFTNPKIDPTVTLKYCVILDYNTSNISVSNETSPEEDEVEMVSWISVDNIDNKNWAFGHGNVIKKLAKELDLHD